MALPANKAATFVPAVMTAPKLGQAKPRAASITFEAAEVAARVECGVDVGWFAAVLRAVKSLP